MWFYTVIITAVCIPHTFPISLTLNSTFMRFCEKLQYWLAASGQKKPQKYCRNGSLHTSHSCEHHFSVISFKTDVVSQLAILWSWSHTLMFSNRSQKHGGWFYYAALDVIMHISIVLHLLFFLSQLRWSWLHHYTSGIYRHAPMCPAAQTVAECSQVGPLMKALGLLSILIIPHWITQLQNAELHWKIYTS